MLEVISREYYYWVVEAHRNIFISMNIYFKDNINLLEVLTWLVFYVYLTHYYYKYVCIFCLTELLKQMSYIIIWLIGFNNRHIKSILNVKCILLLFAYSPGESAQIDTKFLVYYLVSYTFFSLGKKDCYYLLSEEHPSVLSNLGYKENFKIVQLDTRIRFEVS